MYFKLPLLSPILGPLARSVQTQGTSDREERAYELHSMKNGLFM